MRKKTHDESTIEIPSLELSLLPVISRARPKDNSYQVFTIKDFTVDALFTAKPESRRVVILPDKSQWAVGNMLNGDPSPSLSIEHFTVLLLIMRHWKSDVKNPKISLPLGELLEDFYGYGKNNYSKAEYDKLFDLLHELSISRIGRFDPVKNEWEDFNVINIARKIAFSKTKLKSYLMEVTLHSDFVEQLVRRERWRIDSWTLSKIKNKFAKAAYVFLPRRAYHYSEEEPMALPLRKFCEKLGIKTITDDSTAKPISDSILLRKLGIDNRLKSSFISELDKSSSGATGVLRVRYDEKEAVVLVWMEHGEKNLPDTEKKNDRIALTWAENGGRDEVLNRARVRSQGAKLGEFEVSQLSEISKNYTKNEKFYILTEMLIGTDEFLLTLADILDQKKRGLFKNDDSPLKALGHQLMIRISRAANNI